MLSGFSINSAPKIINSRYAAYDKKYYYKR
jgi:hypothetical protein